MMTVQVNDAANYLVMISGNSISNLQVQKILYMADMNFVGKNGERLLSEDFEAWDYGPVLKTLYHKCKAFGSKPVPNVFWGSKDISGTPESAIIDLAWKNLKDATPGQLGPVEIHRVRMIVAPMWIMASKLISVLHARIAIRLNSLSF